MCCGTGGGVYKNGNGCCGYIGDKVSGMCVGDWVRGVCSNGCRGVLGDMCVIDDMFMRFG